jgi:enterochelin esterase-like enzyme
MSGSTVIQQEYEFESLKGNPLGDPVKRIVPVYLPPGYADNEKRYPSVYLLVGFAGRGRKLLNDSLWEEDIQQRMDRLIASGSVQPMILVMPDASTRYGGSQYLNSPAQGNYGDMLLELVDKVDERIHTIPDRDHRAVAGHSSGGYGALMLGMQQPQTFGLVADHSGDKYFELVYKADFPDFLHFCQQAGEQGLKDLLTDPGTAIRQGASFAALNVAAMAASYSPNPRSPLGFDLPLDPVTGELDHEVWQRWLDKDPVELVEEYAGALRSLKLLYFDCGRRDEYQLLYGARILAKRLKALGIPHRYEEFDGGHNNVQYRYDVSLQAISQTFGVK